MNHHDFKLLFNTINSKKGENCQNYLTVLTDAYLNQNYQDLHRVGKHLRDKSCHREALLLSKFMLLNKINLSSAIHDLSISGYYFPEYRKKAKLANFMMIFNPEFNQDPQKYNDACLNSVFFAEKLKYEKSIEIKFESPLIEDPKIERDRYISTSPSLIRKKFGWWGIMRCVNYTQENANVYHFMSKDNKCRTRNYLLSLSENFIIEKSWEIIDNLEYEHYKSSVLGIEDMRLYLINGDDDNLEEMNGPRGIEEDEDDDKYQILNNIKIPFLYGFGNVQDTHNYKVPKMAWLEISAIKDLDWNAEKVEIKKMETIIYPEQSTKIEKNWLFFTENKQPKILYKTVPYTVLDFEDQRVEKIKNETEINLNITDSRFRIRQSAGPLNFLEGKLILVHEVIFRGKNRTYLHRFIWTDLNGLTKISDCFYFDHKGIEFANSMHYYEERGEKKIIISAGIEDKIPMIYKLDVEIVKNMLYGLPKLEDLMEIL